MAKYLQKNLVIGIMSGTSMDGIDTALVEISGFGTATCLNLIKFHTFAFPEKIKNVLFEVVKGKLISACEFSNLNTLLGELFAECALGLLKMSDITPEKIDIIGSHGQTIFHNPCKTDYLGYPISTTLQIGDGSVIAQITGITTISDFRTADIALGGQGAPLVPYFDFITLGSNEYNRVILNIGGIGNISLLPAGQNSDKVIASDTGPGNMIIDALMKYYSKGLSFYDKDGKWCGKGTVNVLLLEQMMQNPYIKRGIPKTTGRELFGEDYTLNLIKENSEISKYDLVATATKFTVLTIADFIKRFCIKKGTPKKPWQLLVSGGGYYNPCIMAGFKKELPDFEVTGTSKYNIPEDAKEAIAFAVLANEAFMGHINVLPHTTGAAHGAILGKISLIKK